MTDNISVLAQISPPATTLTPIYTAANPTTMSSICICNGNSTVGYFRISVAINGAADNIMQYLYYDLPLAGNDTFIATIGLTMAVGDVINVQATLTNFAFNCFGVTIS